MGVNPFLKTGLLAGVLASIACGVIGPYVITRRIVFLSGAVAHFAIGGIGAAIFLSTIYPSTFAWVEPLHGAAFAALLGAVILGIVHEKAHERMDTLIGALWSIGMAVGILLIKYTPGYHTELMSYLFGNITFVPWRSIYLMLGLVGVILGIVLVFHKRFLALCLDEQQVKLQGIAVLPTNIVLLALVGLTVICLMRVVGLILVLALLTLPAATVRHHASRMPVLILLTILLSTALTTIPRIAVYGTKISPECAIVLAAGATYLLSVIGLEFRRYPETLLPRLIKLFRVCQLMGRLTRFWKTSRVTRTERIMMTQQPSQLNAVAKGLLGGILLIQVFDIGIHVATNQIEPLRIASNLIILAWTVVILAGKIHEKVVLATGVTVFTYLACNILFLLREGVTNPNQGGNFRVVLFVLVGVTVGLSVVLAILLSQKRR